MPKISLPYLTATGNAFPSRSIIEQKGCVCYNNLRQHLYLSDFVTIQAVSGCLVLAA